uniref:Reverse transcriptase domain-containing protein n=1 Tax=Schistosoma curassoni TaxID=6186 RepID=A0A183KRC2_9TREM
MAIRQIKSGKATGLDNILAEALKADVAVTVKILILFNKIWDEEQVPTEWKEGLLIKITMKSDLTNCDNYEGITLLSIPGKVFNRVLSNRMKDSVVDQLRGQQAGFRKHRSCTDQITTLRIIVEQSIGWISSLYINFIDYEKAFDSVDRTTLWKLP